MKRKADYDVPSTEKEKTLNLSYKANAASSSSASEYLETLPSNFQSSLSEGLRKVDLSNQIKLDVGQLNLLRFAGETLTWVNLSGVPIGDATGWATWMRMCRTLLVLNVSGCSLTEVPKDLAYATSLKAFVASHNSITSPSLTHLASLTKLNTLILSNNSLTSFPSSLTGNMKQLKKLNLSNNQLSSDTIPSLGGLVALEELRLNGNSGIKGVPEGVDALDHLSILELSTTSLADWKEVDKLAACKGLVNLGLRATKLAEHKEYRNKIIATLPKLRILDNVRFDAKYLERKERIAKKAEAEAGGSANERSVETPVSEKKLGKRKSREHDGETEAQQTAETDVRLSKQDKRKAREAKLNGTSNVAKKPLVEKQPVVPDEDPGPQVKKTRRGKRRPAAEKAAAEEKETKPTVKPNTKKAKTPIQPEPKKAKTVGGSLSDPQAGKVETAKALEPDPEQVLKKSSTSVVAIIAADGTKQSRRTRKVSGTEAEKEAAPASLLQLLQQEGVSRSGPDAVVSGWD